MTSIAMALVGTGRWLDDRFRAARSGRMFLIRQVRHWASDLFMAAIMAHTLWVFFTGAYRKPRDGNWLISLPLLVLSLGEALFGTWPPGGLLSGTGGLWAEADNDIIASHLNIPLYTITWTDRIACVAGPVLAYIVTKRICLRLQRGDLAAARASWQNQSSRNPGSPAESEEARVQLRPQPRREARNVPTPPPVPPS